MSFWKSLENQVGRDTGRRVSNAIWGDKHASVHRHISSKSSEISELKAKQLEAEIALREREQKRNMLIQLRYSVDEKIRQLTEIDIPEDKLAMIALLNKLAILLKSNCFKHNLDEANRINNAYTDAILIKYEQILKVATCQFPEDSEFMSHVKRLKYTQKFGFFRKHIVITIILCLIFLFALFMLFAIIFG